MTPGREADDAVDEDTAGVETDATDDKLWFKQNGSNSCNRCKDNIKVIDNCTTRLCLQEDTANVNQPAIKQLVPLLTSRQNQYSNYIGNKFNLWRMPWKNFITTTHQSQPAHQNQLLHQLKPCW